MGTLNNVSTKTPSKLPASIIAMATQTQANNVY